MKLHCGDLLGDSSLNRPRYINAVKLGFLCFAALSFGALLMFSDYKHRISNWGTTDLLQITPVDKEQIVEANSCSSSCETSGTESLPRGIIRKTTNLERRSLGGSVVAPKPEVPAKSLLAIASGLKQKGDVDEIVKKFPSSDFTVMIFHYDGNVDGWKDLEWSSYAVHVAAKEQTKWWFAKRFLHPDIVAEYNYIFLWDEDLGVENFNPTRYLEIVKKEGLEISQPALDTRNSEVHHRITARARKGDVHRRAYKFHGHSPCYENSSAPPCTGWVEMMAPVFSRVAWRCTWHMIQNDLIHAWGLDYKLGYCAQGDRTMKVGVVDREYIVHKGIPSLGAVNETEPLEKPGTSKQGAPASKDRIAVRQRSYEELKIFNSRWRRAAEDDKCWTDPFPKQ